MPLKVFLLIFCLPFGNLENDQFDQLVVPVNWWSEFMYDSTSSSQLHTGDASSTRWAQLFAKELKFCLKAATDPYLDQTRCKDNLILDMLKVMIYNESKVIYHFNIWKSIMTCTKNSDDCRSPCSLDGKNPCLNLSADSTGTCIPLSSNPMSKYISTKSDRSFDLSDTISDFKCSCLGGMFWNFVTRKCERTSVCSQQHPCFIPNTLQCKDDVNEIGSFECICKEGFEGPLCQNPRNVCALETDPCGTHGLCELLINSTAHWPSTFQCRCLEGFRADPDLQSPNCEALIEEEDNVNLLWVALAAILISFIFCSCCWLVSLRKPKKKEKSKPKQHEQRVGKPQKTKKYEWGPKDKYKDQKRLTAEERKVRPTAKSPYRSSSRRKVPRIRYENIRDESVSKIRRSEPPSDQGSPSRKNGEKKARGKKEVRGKKEAKNKSDVKGGKEVKGERNLTNKTEDMNKSQENDKKEVKDEEEIKDRAEFIEKSQAEDQKEVKNEAEVKDKKEVIDKPEVKDKKEHKDEPEVKDEEEVKGEAEDKDKKEVMVKSEGKSDSSDTGGSEVKDKPNVKDNLDINDESKVKDGQRTSVKGGKGVTKAAEMKEQMSASKETDKSGKPLGNHATEFANDRQGRRHSEVSLLSLTRSSEDRSNNSSKVRRSSTPVSMSTTAEKPSKDPSDIHPSSHLRSRSRSFEFLKPSLPNYHHKHRDQKKKKKNKKLKKSQSTPDISRSLDRPKSSSSSPKISGSPRSGHNHHSSSNQPRSRQQNAHFNSNLM